MKTIAIASLACSVALFAIGCSESRQSQCQKIGIVTRQVQDDVMAVHQSRIGQPAYAPKFDEHLATVMAESAETMEAVEVKDKRLQTLQTRLVKSYQYSSDLYQQAAQLLPANGVPTDAVIEQVDAIHRRVDQDLPETIHDLNVYCIGG